MSALTDRVAELERCAAVSARLREALHGRQPKVVAADLGVTVSAVSRWQHGGPILQRNLVALCDYLNISADWLLLGRGHAQSHVVDFE